MKGETLNSNLIVLGSILCPRKEVYESKLRNVRELKSTVLVSKLPYNMAIKTPLLYRWGIY